VSALVDGEQPSTKAAADALATIASSRHVLAVVERADVVTWKSLRNVETVHVIAPDQLNTYDVLVADDLVFTEGALRVFLGGEASEPRLVPAGPIPAKEKPAAAKTSKKAAPAKKAAKKGATKPAGEDVSDEDAVTEVAEQTSSDLKAEDVFEREADGATTDTEAAEASADEVSE
jgi:large subunit ribosomal protein L4